MREPGGQGGRRLRLVAIADSDSYLKWAASTLSALPADAELVVVDTPVRPSPGQLAAAVQGSAITAEAVRVLALADVVARVASVRPDAVLVATRGPQARVLLRELARLDPRPALVTGLPGISIPATSKALFFRHQADLLIVHSHREVREFRALAAEGGAARPIALATLPFARAGAPPGEEILRGPRGRDLVFAVQSRVPADLGERRHLARILLEAADADAARRVVVKVRAVGRERQTHDERHPLPTLIAREAARAGREVPPNLVVSNASMAAALETAQGLATVSSTAAIEAIARGVPVLALDTFGVSDALINTVFEASGVLGSADDLVKRRFRHPSAEWLHDNYFHASEDDELADRLGQVCEARRRGELAPRDGLPVVGGELRLRWQRLRAFPGSERAPVRILVAAIGHPAHTAVRLARWISRPFRTRAAADRATGSYAP